MTFSPSQIITGYTIPLNSPKIEHVVFATVNPPAEASNIAFVISGVNRVDITIYSRNTTTGDIVLGVSGNGVGPTPVGSPNGDTTILAQDGGSTVGQAQAVVVIPASVGTPHDAPAGNVTPANMVLDAGTSPAWWGLSPGYVALVTVYLHWTSIDVWDQFGNLLDQVYNGLEVYEEYPSTGQFLSINQIIDSGSYTDPVGYGEFPSPYIVLAGSTAANNWPTAAQVPLETISNLSVSPTVSIGGHVLNPSILNRTISTTPPYYVKINWP